MYTQNGRQSQKNIQQCPEDNLLCLEEKSKCKNP